MAGILALAAGYVIWDNYKRNKEQDNYFKKQAEAKKSREYINNNLSDIKDSVTAVRKDFEGFRKESQRRFDAIESKIYKSDHHIIEAQRMHAITNIAPSINTIIRDGLDDCKVDHIAVCLLHNGTQTITGIPYIKFGVVAEKYKPIKHIHDVDLLSQYREEDIVSHNQLPACIIQNKNVIFNIAEDSPLVEIDPIVYAKCVKLGIEQIAFEAIRDIRGLITGFMMVYKFDEEEIDMNALHQTTSNIEVLYRNMMEQLSSN